MNSVKKYRIMSIEAEALVHSQMVGGFFTRTNGKVNLKLFSGILDYSLESEKIRETWENTPKMSRKAYFSEDGYDYTTAVINVKFKYTRHNFVKMDGVFLREGYLVSEAFSDSAEVVEDEFGNKQLVAIKLYKTLKNPPLDDEILGECFVYDEKKNYYVRRKSENGLVVQFDSVEEKISLRKKLYRDGFDCDGIHYVRYKRSAGSSRTGQCLFIAEPIYNKMRKWSLCGLDMKNRSDVDVASFEAYVSLSLSSIKKTLRIPKNSILFMRDEKSVFETDAVCVESNNKGRLSSRECKVTVSNVIWDGEAVLDAGMFKEAGYAGRGMMLLRNRFFKTCAFNTNLSKYFADNGITEVSQLSGYTRAEKIEDIKLIVTESSLKYLKLSNEKGFEAKIEAWLDNVDDLFGIVKTDKPTSFFDGRVVRTSYQVLNTLGFSRDEARELLDDTFDYYMKVRNSPMYMRNYINYTLSVDDDEDDSGVEYFSARQRAILGCLERNDDFVRTEAYSEFRQTVLSSFSRKIRSGRLLVLGTNATIFGNGLELLAAAIGKFRITDGALALAGEGKIYCKHFLDGEELLGCRSPHVTMGNLLYAENTRVEDVDKYFNLTGEIVYVNAIGCNIQQRLNGCDYDSDAMLLTNNPLMVKAAKRNTSFAVPVCSIDSTPKHYEDSPEGKASLDHEISQNKIGEIINLSQHLNTLYWHNKVNTEGADGANHELYLDICILAVLSGMEIDKAKRNYNVATDSILKRLKSKYKMEALPEFFKFIMYTLEEKKYKGKIKSYDTTMDYIFSLTKSFTRTGAKNKEQKMRLSDFIVSAELGGLKIKSQGNDSRDKKDLLKYVERCCFEIGERRIGLKGLDNDEKYQVRLEIEAIYSDAIDCVSKKLTNFYILKSLLWGIDEHLSPESSIYKKLYWILFETLCLEEKHLFYDVLSKAREKDMHDLVPCENGDIYVYGIRHTEKMAKKAKK